MEEYNEKHKGVSILLRQSDKNWSWSATPTKMLRDRVIGNAFGGGNGGFSTKEEALADAKNSIDKWLFRH